MKKIVVAGSINMDIVTGMQRYPQPGETIYGNSFNTFPGGKGANQAVAVGRLGGNVTFLGKIGNDLYGTEALRAMNDAGVDVSHIEKADINTGVACIWVNGEGENCIVLSPGANSQVDIAYIERHLEVFDDCGAVLLQFEIPLDTVCWIAKYCKERGITVILDPAPAALCNSDLLSCVDYVTPNETELSVASGCSDESSAVSTLLEKGCKYVLNKLGPEGCRLISKDISLSSSGFKVKAIDTTAAGDSFNAGFAYALMEGMDLQSSMTFANAVGAIAVTGMGAQSAMPSYEQVKEFIITHQK